jgi:CelD/BcsL family acetyltransferase involved in cellulose biosynthesis
VVLPLADTWEQTRTGLRRNVKESLRRARNRLAKDGRPWRVMWREGTALDDVAVDRLLQLHRDRARYAGSRSRHVDAFADVSTQAFVREVLPRLGSAGQASIVELELGGEVVAAQLVLHAPRGIYFHSSGFRTQEWDLSPVTTLQAAAIEAANARSERWVNFSPGPNESKLRWSENLHVVREVAYGAGGAAAFTRFAGFMAGARLRTMIERRSPADDAS